MATFLTNFVFFHEATSTGVSNTLDNSHADSIVIQVSGSYLTAKFIVEAKTDIDADFVPVCLFNLANAQVIKNGIIETSTNPVPTEHGTINGRYSILAEGVVQMRIRLTAVSGGNITIFGKTANSMGV